MAKVLDRSQISKHILEIIGHPNSICFAGAGVGVRVGLPDWAGYMESLAAVADKYEPETAVIIRKRAAERRYPEAATFYKLATIPEGVKLTGLAAPFQPESCDPSPLKPLVSLPFTAFVTTNYDRSLHNAWAAVRSEAAQTAELHDPTLKMAIHSRQPYIARIHGRAEVPQQMVVATDDYADLEHNNDAYTDFLFHILSNQNCLFLGFSFLDPAIRSVLESFRRRTGPVFPKEHSALVPAGAEDLTAFLAKFNIRCLLYAGGPSDHDELWAGVAEAARQSSRTGPAEPIYSAFPAALENARRLFASAYVHMKMQPALVPMRQRIVEGIVLALVSDGGRKGLTRAEIAERLSTLMPFSIDEALSLTDETLSRLLPQRICAQAEDRIVCEIDDQKFQQDISYLAQAILNRYKARESITVPPNAPEILAGLLDDTILMRGWDLGAHFAGASIPPSAGLWAVLAQSLARRAPNLPAHLAEQLRRATYDLLTRPEPKEAAILSGLGRLAYAVDIVLQHGRTALSQHLETLPERIYLDASYVMPAIVNGHPLRPAYAETLDRWITAAQAAGLSPRLLVTDDFLDEIVSHRAIGIETVAAQGLDDPKLLAQYVLFYGTEGINVFISAYASSVGRVPDNPPTFAQWLDDQAPYRSINELRSYLSERGYETMRVAADTHRDYRLVLHALQTAYDADRNQPRRKLDILINHEARQLTQLKRDLDKGLRSVFVTADNRLRRLVIGPVLGPSGEATLSPLGFIQLIDFLVGLEPEPASLARLMWGVHFVDELANPDLRLRTYFADRALQTYDAALALGLPKILDELVSAAASEAKREGLHFNEHEDPARVAKFLDRFEEGFFKNLSEAMEKLQRHDQR